jgi:hypothetical protein
VRAVADQHFKGANLSMIRIPELDQTAFVRGMALIATVFCVSSCTAGTPRFETPDSVTTSPKTATQIAECLVADLNSSTKRGHAMRTVREGVEIEVAPIVPMMVGSEDYFVTILQGVGESTIQLKARFNFDRYVTPSIARCA